MILQTGTDTDRELAIITAASIDPPDADDPRDHDIREPAEDPFAEEITRALRGTR